MNHLCRRAQMISCIVVVLAGMNRPSQAFVGQTPSDGVRHSWSGFYVGANAGYGWANAHNYMTTRNTAGVPTNSPVSAIEKLQNGCGVADKVWSMTDMAEMIHATLPKPGKRGPYKVVA